MHFVEAKGILTGGKGHYGMNIYRGCSHGCIYCDSRSKCYQFTHAFEDIEVKQNAPELLEQALKSKRKNGMIGTGSMPIQTAGLRNITCGLKWASNYRIRRYL